MSSIFCKQALRLSCLLCKKDLAFMGAYTLLLPHVVSMCVREREREGVIASTCGCVHTKMNWDVLNRKYKSNERVLNEDND